MDEPTPAINPHHLPALWPPDYKAFANELPECKLSVPADPLAGIESCRWDEVSNRRQASTSVQPPETNPPDSEKVNDWGYRLTSDDPPVIFRHSGWARARRQVRDAMVANMAPPRALQRFDLCGSDPWVVVNELDPTDVQIHSNHCHSRWCVPCSRERAARIVGNLKYVLQSGCIRFLTLTLKHSADPLAGQVTRIYSAFRRLRRAEFWLKSCIGGCAILEIVRGQHDELWHVHLHCLLQGTYIRHADLKAEWYRITGDSYVVHIKPVWNKDHAASYVTKYITKPLSNTVINKPEPLLQLISACNRRRLVLTWGSWRGIRMSAKLDDVRWKSLLPLDELYARADDGDEDALTLVAALERNVPKVRILAGRDPPEEEPTPDTTRLA